MRDELMALNKQLLALLGWEWREGPAWFKGWYYEGCYQRLSPPDLLLDSRPLLAQIAEEEWWCRLEHKKMPSGWQWCAWVSLQGPEEHAPQWHVAPTPGEALARAYVVAKQAETS